MNKVEYIGRLTSDGELSFSTTGHAYYRNTIAVDRKFKKDGEPTADFFRFVMFGSAAETFQKWTVKGSKVYISGRNQNNDYTNKEGQKVRDINLMVEEFEFLDSKTNKEETKTDRTDAKEEKNDFLSVPDGLVEELPFS